MQQDAQFDVAIVGGGLAGALCALALDHAGLSVALIDAQSFQAQRAPLFDGRTTALAYACVRVFERLGVWAPMAAEAAPIRDILVTDGRRATRLAQGGSAPFFLHFDSRELGGEGMLGVVLENRVIRAALAARIEALPQINVFAPADADDVTFSDGSAALRLSDGRRLGAKLVVAADGKHSQLRKRAGIGAREWSYDQAGIVVTAEHERPHEGVAQEFFLPSGPFAILPLTDAPSGAHRSSLVWTERADAAPAYMALPDDQFSDEIARRFGEYLGGVRAVRPRWSYPLSFHFSRRFIGPRLALLGDAARGVHPIAGQGFNFGVKDVAALAETLGEARSLGLDIGAANILEDYEKRRRFDSAALGFGMDALNRLFSNDIGPLRLARTLGMAAAGAAAPTRRFFMRQAGADLGALPALMRPFR